MGGDAEADEELAGEGEANGGTGGVKLAVGAGDKGVEAVAAFFEADAVRGGFGGLDLMGVVAGGVAELERGEAVAVEGDVDGGRAGIEALADHQDGLAVLVAAGTDEVDVGGEAEIAGGLLPDELELILAEPHVLAGAGESVGAGGRIVLGGAGVEDGADVLGMGEEAEGRRALSGEDCRGSREEHSEQREAEAECRQGVLQ